MNRLEKIVEAITAGGGISDEQLGRRVRSSLDPLQEIERMISKTASKTANVYESMIRDDLRKLGRPDIKPSWVEGYLRLQHGTLDSLSREQFLKDTAEIIETIDADPRAARELARSYGLVAKIVAAEDTTAAQKMLEYVVKGTAVLTAQEIGIPTIHNFAKKYHSSVNHLGYGCFVGKTEHGEFSFDGGGAMYRDGAVSWTILQASPQVLRDLGYDIKKVEKVLEGIVSKTASSKERWDKKITRTPKKHDSEYDMLEDTPEFQTRDDDVVDRERAARALLKIAKMLMAIDFPTQHALDKYLHDHPDADRSNHKVVKTTNPQAPQHHPIVHRILENGAVSDIGQFSGDEKKALDKAVRDGVLSKGKGGNYPTLKMTYYPTPKSLGAASEMVKIAKMLMGEMGIKDKLVSALTQYDKRQSTKSYYNHHALALYFEALDRAEEEVNKGKTWEEALNKCFNDRVLDVCLKALK